MWTRINFLLLIVLIGCALSVITSQHQSRKLFIDLEKEQESARKLDQEWRELQLESQTLAKPKRIEQKAVAELGMRTPEPGKTAVVVLEPKP
ncbi:MAG: cell division protein FtsL [Betaproteobacteria bacterium]|nr:cell division protein FtsL [Betaproteobacteria bacterium]